MSTAGKKKQFRSRPRDDDGDGEDDTVVVKPKPKPVAKKEGKAKSAVMLSFGDEEEAEDHGLAKKFQASKEKSNKVGAKTVDLDPRPSDPPYETATLLDRQA
jgi:hypothetical protein